VRGVDLQTLTKFLKRVETGARPVFFTHISLKRRFSEADKLDAELTAIGFERIKEKAPTKKKSDGTDSAGELGGSSGRNKSSKESQ